MRTLFNFLGASWLLFATTSSAADQVDVLKYVDPLIGTINGGHVFPGATLPFGMAKAGADTTGENQGGWDTKGYAVNGFSHMHDSGTGGSPSLGNFPIMPLTGCPDNNASLCNFEWWGRAASKKNYSATPSYFMVELGTDIRAEMTTSNHTALYRFTFPEPEQNPADNSSSKPVIVSDVIDLPKTVSARQVSVNSTTGRMTGQAYYEPSFGQGVYRLSFCADFKGADILDTGVWTTKVGTKSIDQGTWVMFDAPKENNQIFARVGVSFISEDQACSHAEKEVPTYDFESLKTAGEQAWRDKLEVVSLKTGGVSEEFQTIFWSGVYRSLISPQDYTGENYYWTSDEPYYDSYYCIWDSFRTIHPLLTMIDPISQSLMVRSLIDIYRHEGKLPDCRMSLCKGLTQGGSNADVVLADAYLKNISNIDWVTAYEAVVSDAEIEPQNWDVEGRGGLKSWKELHYIPYKDVDTLGTGTMTRSVSRTVEYAYDDFCIAEMAENMGHYEDAIKYYGRSENWRNLYKHDQNSSIKGVDTGFVGFLQPRNTSGGWFFQDPIFCSPLLEPDSCYLNAEGHETYEGSCWLYSFFVPGDMASLIITMGGADAFVKRLDYFHESGLLYMGDEQSFLNVFLYHYAGRPALSAERSHYYIPKEFNTTVNGIPGNDDSGAMGSYIALCMMGLFPNAGQNVYLITPPFFEEVKILNQQTGKTATIRNINFDPNYDAIYIQSAKLNGQTYTKNWLDHSFYLEGGTLELTLGPKESSWGTQKEDLPPSMSTRPKSSYPPEYPPEYTPPHGRQT